jgi:hypothetical protein
METAPRMSHVSPALYATLADAVPDLHVHCLDPWCLIGSTGCQRSSTWSSSAPITSTGVPGKRKRAKCERKRSASGGVNAGSRR